MSSVSYLFRKMANVVRIRIIAARTRLRWGTIAPHAVEGRPTPGTRSTLDRAGWGWYGIDQIGATPTEPPEVLYVRP